jgi:ribonuclease HI
MLRLNFIKDLTKLEIYTDGSSKAGMGSWAYVICRRRNCIEEKSGRIRGATSNVMEFQAAIEALSAIPPKSKVTLYSDSRILVDAMKFGNGPRAYQAQIDVLAQLSQKHKISWQWVKAHNANKFNERCDELCAIARGSPTACKPSLN